MLEAIVFAISHLGMPQKGRADVVNVVSQIQQLDGSDRIDPNVFAEERKTIIALASKSAKLDPILDAATKNLIKHYDDLDAFARKVEQLGVGPEGLTLDEAINFVCSICRSATSDSLRKLDNFMLAVLTDTAQLDTQAIESAKKVKTTFIKIQKYFDEAATLINQVSITSVASNKAYVTQSDLTFLRTIGDKFVASLA